MTNDELKRAFYADLKPRMTAWALDEGLALDNIGELELGTHDGSPAMFVNLKDGRRRVFPFELQKVH